MSEIVFINRVTRQREFEMVYGQMMIELSYGDGWFSRLFSFLFLPLFARISLLSWAYGRFQKSRLSRWKVKPFVQHFQVDASEFLKPLEAFTSFNDFFIRKLKPNVRPCAAGADVAVLPADGRYLVFPDVSLADGFWVKGKRFDLEAFLGDSKLAKQYEKGAMAIARLCPVDYHRFHFPCANVAGKSRLINGPLYSVNPMALKRNIAILSENKRVITPLETEFFGVVQYVEIGATFVGSIQQTFESGTSYAKGAEKGYFEFGGSCLILLFEPGKIVFDQDLIEASLSKIETRGLLGQSLGRAP